MQFVSECSTADDGAQVQSGVFLDVDALPTEGVTDGRVDL